MSHSTPKGLLSTKPAYLLARQGDLRHALQPALDEGFRGGSREHARAGRGGREGHDRAEGLPHDLKENGERVTDQNNLKIS